MKLRYTPPAEQSETDHQKLCVEYAEQIGLGDFLISIPNGNQLPGGPETRARYMAHLKKMGLKPGASDLFLAKPVQLEPDHRPQLWYHGAWFEMKRIKRSSTSSDQVAFLLNMRKEGYYVDVCKGFDAFRASLTNYLAGGPCAYAP